MKKLLLIALLYMPLYGSSTNPQPYNVEVNAVVMIQPRLFLTIEPNDAPDITEVVIEPPEVIQHMPATRRSSCPVIYCGVCTTLVAFALVGLLALYATRT